MKLIFKEGEFKLLWAFYLAFFMIGLLAVVAPYIVIYFLNIGLNYFQIAILTTCTGIATFLFEIPTGAFADSYSRKYSVILSFILQGLCFIAIAYSTNFIFLVFMFFIWGVAATFESGAFEAWTIDNLHILKRKDLQHEFFIKTGSIGLFGAIFAPFLASILLKFFNMNFLWVFTGCGIIIAGLILAFFTDECYKPKRAEKNQAIFSDSFNKSVSGIKILYTKKALFIYLIALAFASLMTLGELGWTPFLLQLNMPEDYVGYLYSILALVCSVVVFFSRFFKDMKLKYSILILISFEILISMSILFIYPPFFYIAAFIFLLLNGLEVIQGPLLNTYIHKHIPTKIRATVVSAMSSINSIKRILIGLVGGVLLDAFGPKLVIAFSSLFGIIAIIFYFKLK